MFVTIPDFEFRVPEALRPHPLARHWRLMALHHFGAWHVVSMRVGQGSDEHVASFILASDQDLLTALEDSHTRDIISLTSIVDAHLELTQGAHLNLTHP
jgi:hypothetical protein